MNKKKFETIDEYIATFPKDVQAILEKIRTTIQTVAPEATETMSYQLPTFKLKGRNLVHFAAFKHHIGFYPTPSGISAFKRNCRSLQVQKARCSSPLISQCRLI